MCVAKNNIRKYNKLWPKVNKRCFATFYIQYCTGLGWDRINFLHSTSEDAMLWICGQNSVDNTQGLVFAEQRLYRAKNCSASHAALPARRCHSQELTQIDQRDTPYRMISCLAVKAEHKGERGGHSE